MWPWVGLYSELTTEATSTEIINEHAKDKNLIETAINQWVDAWSNQDIDSYLASYAKDFIPPKGLSNNRWERQRTERLLAPSYIKITLSNLKINMRGKNYVRVDFTQTYESDTYKDQTKKELTDFIEQLNTKQFKEVQKIFDTMPRLKHTIKIKNPKTKKESEITLSGLNDFFG